MLIQASRLRRALRLGGFTLTLIALVWAATTAVQAEDPATGPWQSTSSDEVIEFTVAGSPGLSSLTPASAYSTNLSGHVYVWDQGRLRPASQARVSTGSALVRTDPSGRFEFAPDQRTGSLSVVQPGYDTVRRPIYFDQSVVILRSLVVRAVYIPSHDLNEPWVRNFVHDLIDRDLINAVVIDIKNENGAVYDFAATETVHLMNADMEGDDVVAFLDSLQAKGVYRIGRVVTFLDRWYSTWFPNNALHNLAGGPFIDSMGSRWASPYSPQARRYNIEIGLAAAPYVDEIQYDYVRLPYENNLLERTQYTEAERVNAINTFAREASEALHMAGLALSFDTFGVVSTSGNDQGIGQSISGVSPHLDYVSPMVYPSGWSAGSFGYNYPPAHPGPVVQENVRATVELIAEEGTALVRPWLQDFRDYQYQALYYTAERVLAQIEGTVNAGGFGFMLWDPLLQYQQEALRLALGVDWISPD